VPRIPKKPPTSPRRTRPNHDEIVSLVGDLEDAVIAAIAKTGASYAEIEQAARQAGAEADEPRPDAHGLSLRAEAVYDILVADPNFVGVEDRPRTL
jgi:hypothetical protein